MNPKSTLVGHLMTGALMGTGGYDSKTKRLVEVFHRTKTADSATIADKTFFMDFR